MKKKIVFCLLLVIFLGHFVFRVHSYRDEYTKPYEAAYWEQRYLQSQWVDPVSKNPIGDDGLYAYAGYEYITGRDPTTLNAELPPLGKYAIGLSILLFKNQTIFALLSGISALMLFFLFNKHIFKDSLIALIPVTLFSLEPLFYTQLRAPFLDLFQLCFLFITMTLFLQKRYVFMMLAFGLMVSVKATSGMLPLFFVVCLTHLLLTKQYREIKKIFLYVPIAIIVFIATYFQYFLNGHSLFEFFGVQKYIVNFYAIGAKGNPFTIWRMFIDGTWITHWGATIRVDEWWIGWTVLLSVFGFQLAATGLSVFSIQFGSRTSKFKTEKLKTDKPESENRKLRTDYQSSTTLMVLWIGAYLIFLMVVPVWPRYLLLLLPFLYNLSIQLCQKILHFR